jgi:hypothetical protein
MPPVAGGSGLERGAAGRTLFMEREREFVREITVQGFKYPWTRLAGHCPRLPDFVRLGRTLSDWHFLSRRIWRTKIFQDILKLRKRIALRLRVYIDIGHGLQIIIT